MTTKTHTHTHRWESEEEYLTGREELAEAKISKDDVTGGVYEDVF